MTLPNSSSAHVWQIVKKNNAFAVRGRTGDRPRFSRERGNLLSLHSFKHSGEKKRTKKEQTLSFAFLPVFSFDSFLDGRENRVFSLRRQRERKKERGQRESKRAGLQWTLQSLDANGRLGRQLPSSSVAAAFRISAPRLFIRTSWPEHSCVFKRVALCS